MAYTPLSPRLRGDCGRPGPEPDDQSKPSPSSRRDGRSGWGHRPGGGCGDGGQGDAVEGVRRRRRLAHLPGDDRRRQDRRGRHCGARVGAINRRHLRAPVLRDRRAPTRIARYPVFHDDQHGTAIVVYAALVNALRVVGNAEKSGSSSPGRRREHRDDADPAARRCQERRQLRSGRAVTGRPGLAGIGGLPAQAATRL